MSAGARPRRSNVLSGETYWLTTRGPGATVPALLLEILTKELAPASSRTACPLPPGFDAWFVRAVCRNAAERFPDAIAAWQALEPMLAPYGVHSTMASAAPQAGSMRVQSSLAYGPTMVRETTTRPSSSAGRWIAAAIVSVVFLGAGGVVYVAWLRAHEDKKRASTDREASEETESDAPPAAPKPKALYADDGTCPKSAVRDCSCKSKHCQYSCVAAVCSLRAESGSHLSGECLGSACDVTCASGSSCKVRCAGGCNMTCEAGATCFFECPSGQCIVSCSPKATSCTTNCTGGTCLQQ